MQQDRKIADLLRYGVRDDGQRRGDAERVVGEKCGRDDDAVAEVMHAVADQDHRTRTPGEACCRRMQRMIVLALVLIWRVVLVAVRMAP